MPRVKFVRSLFAIATIATLSSAPVMLQATEMHPLVVTGILLEKGTTAHPTPQYPRFALQLGIDGRVQLKAQVQNGEIVEATASAGAPMLGYEPKQGTVRCWQFKREATWGFRIPFDY